MRLSDLITDAGTGQLSHTKLWANVAYAAATWAIINAAVMAELSPDLLLIYLGIVGASATASKFLSLRYGGATPPQPGDKTAS